jgi:hypothetical protein
MLFPSAKKSARPAVMNIKNALPSSLKAAARSGSAPRYSSLPVIFASAGSSCSKRTRSPDANITPLLSSAFFGPMNTGACWNATPRSAQRAARAFVPAGEVVV